MTRIAVTGSALPSRLAAGEAAPALAGEPLHCQIIQGGP